jgi:hypothetical protein
MSTPDKIIDYLSVKIDGQSTNESFCVNTTKDSATTAYFTPHQFEYFGMDTNQTTWLRLAGDKSSQYRTDIGIGTNRIPTFQATDSQTRPIYPRDPAGTHTRAIITFGNGTDTILTTGEDADILTIQLTQEYEEGLSVYVSDQFCVCTSEATTTVYMYDTANNAIEKQRLASLYHIPLEKYHPPSDTTGVIEHLYRLVVVQSDGLYLYLTMNRPDFMDEVGVLIHLPVKTIPLSGERNPIQLPVRATHIHSGWQGVVRSPFDIYIDNKSHTESTILCIWCDDRYGGMRGGSTQLVVESILVVYEDPSFRPITGTHRSHAQVTITELHNIRGSNIDKAVDAPFDLKMAKISPDGWPCMFQMNANIYKLDEDGTITRIYTGVHTFLDWCYLETMGSPVRSLLYTDKEDSTRFVINPGRFRQVPGTNAKYLRITDDGTLLYESNDAWKYRATVGHAIDAYVEGVTRYADIDPDRAHTFSPNRLYVASRDGDTYQVRRFLLYTPDLLGSASMYGDTFVDQYLQMFRTICLSEYGRGDPFCRCANLNNELTAELGLLDDSYANKRLAALSPCLDSDCIVRMKMGNNIVSRYQLAAVDCSMDLTVCSAGIEADKIDNKSTVNFMNACGPGSLAQSITNSQDPTWDITSVILLAGLLLSSLAFIVWFVFVLQRRRGTTTPSEHLV